MVEHKKWSCIDIAITTYFAGMVFSGVTGFSYTSLDEHYWDDITAMAFSWAMVGTGLGGVIASVARSRQGEFIAIVLMSFLTLVQGLLLIEDLQAAIRLVFAPFMMVSFAAIRKGFNLSKRDVDQIKLRLRRGLADDQ
jgi:hypothetical protein